MNKNIYTVISILFLIIGTYSCVEKYEPKTSVFESVLVVESTITNELKKQQVKLSRTIPIDSIIPDSEKDALVRIKTATGDVYDFTEVEAGLYESDVPFQAEPNVAYQLFITTASGESYQSTEEKITPIAPIENVYAERPNIEGTLGAQVYVDSQENPQAKYFRYEYEETYKIVTPFIITHDLILSDIEDAGTPFLEYKMNVQPITIEKHICYDTAINSKLILSSLDNNISNVGIPIRFLPSTDFMLRERYSILVRQYVQNINEYKFYKILSKFNGIGNLLSEIQKGYILGNIKNVNNAKDNVVGFFGVDSYSEKRIYSNYNDFSFEKSDYFVYCTNESFVNFTDNPLDYEELGCQPCNPQVLNEREIIFDAARGFYNNPELLNWWFGIDSHGNSYVRMISFVKSECGNCSTFASNVRPDFWQD